MGDLPPAACPQPGPACRTRTFPAPAPVWGCQHLKVACCHWLCVGLPVFDPDVILLWSR